MAWVAVDKNGSERIFEEEPTKYEDSVYWIPDCYVNSDFVWLPKGTIEKIIGRKLTFEDEPVELK